MAGVPTSCKNNTELGRVGCGAEYRGREVHCTNPAEWSKHSDGLCHETFGGYSTFDMHWTINSHLNPETLSSLHRDSDRGVWRQDTPGAFI